jgi:hypothetical protein
MLNFEQIDAKIEILERELQRLRADRNSLTIITRVPAEVLILVCKELRSSSRHPGALNSFLNTCRYIYRTGISTPELWTYLNSAWGPDWLNLCMARAHSLPLTVLYDTMGRHKRHEELDYSTLVSRASVVDIDYSSSVPLPITIKKALQSRAPLMESITIRSSHQHRFGFGNHLIGGTCGSLQSLNLTHAVLSQAPDLPSLRNLVLTSCLLQIDCFIQMLEVSPLLEDVRLDDIDLGLESYFTPEHDTVVPKLVNLQKLSISQHRQEPVPTLLEIMSHPSSSLELNLWPFTHEGSWTTVLASSSHSIVAYMEHFWKSATGQDKLPYFKFVHSCSWVPARPRIDPLHYTHMLKLDHRRNIGEQSPPVHLFLSATYHLINDDALGSQIRTLQLDLGGDRIGLRRQAHAMNVDLLTHLEHLYIEKAFKHDWLWELHGEHDMEELHEWVRQLAAAGRPLKTITFYRCRKEIRELLDDIVDNQLVEEGYWGSDFESEEEE